MPECQLVGLAAQSQSENLMAQADAKNRFVPEQSPHSFVRIKHGGGVGRTEVYAGEHCFLCTIGSDMTDQSAGIDTLDAWNARAFEIYPERHFGAPVRRPWHILLDDETFDIHPVRFVILSIDADIADF